MPQLAVPTTDAKAEWRALAACTRMAQMRKLLVNAWITEHSLLVVEAREICEECPVRMLCLSDALTDPNSFGMRGGYFFSRGALLKKEADRLLKEFGILARIRTKSRDREN